MCSTTDHETNKDSPQGQTSSPEKHYGPSLLPLCMCTVGICTCYLYYGILQEEFFSTETARVGVIFLLTIQAMSNATVAFLWTSLVKLWSSSSNKSLTTTSTTTTTTRRRLNHPLLFLTAFCFTAAMTGTNESLRFVSYPTAVLAKSSKLIPTMLLGWMVERRMYKCMEWIAALCITGGVVMFHLSRANHHGQQQTEQASSLYGMGLLSLSLLMDGLLGACQGLLKSSEHPPTAMETMLYVNVYATLLWLPFSIYLGQWTHGWELIRQQEDTTFWRGMLALNATAAVGQVFIFLTITWYSSLTCTTITTTRKFFTILLSVLHFGHVFTKAQWCCVALVFAGLYLSLASKKASLRSVHDAGVAEGNLTRKKVD